MTERLPPMPEPLTPEERALAARLARLGPHGEPSPALDARILAAARAEMPAVGPPRKQARWPLAFGIAASVALAVGLAWQLRPLPEAVTYDEAASAVAAAESAQAVQAESTEAMPMEAPAEDAAATAAAPAIHAEPAPAPAVDKDAPEAFRRIAAPAREVASQSRAAGAEATASNPSSRPAPVRAHSAPPAPPAPPPAPVVLQAPPAMESEAGAAASAADTTLPAPPAAVAGAAKARAPVAQQAAARDAAAAAERRARNQAAAAESHAASPVVEDSSANEPFVEDIPPATADSPAVRDAWLHRIRELHAAGDTDAARASLREFVRRYPAFPLPEDLRPLLD